MKKLLILITACIASHPVVADDVRVAVAANFKATLQQLSAPFSTSTGHQLIISSGSTGKLYAQLINGAPYDVLLAADSQRPALLEQQGIGATDSRFTYAMGRLLLCGEQLDKTDPAHWLESDAVRRIALANPRHAPYGQAAVAALDAMNASAAVTDKFITGENVSQVLQFLVSGNANAAFIARSQRSAFTGPCIPAGYEPVVQQGILMNSEAATLEFKAFLQSAEAARIIELAGYDVPLIKQQPSKP